MELGKGSDFCGVTRRNGEKDPDECTTLSSIVTCPRHACSLWPSHSFVLFAGGPEGHQAHCDGQEPWLHVLAESETPGL